LNATIDFADAASQRRNNAMTKLLIDPATLAVDLCASHALLDEVTRALDDSQWLGPRLPIVNPPLWELGHVAWFQERWCLRQRADEQLADSILHGADALYDSSSVAHATRWTLPLPAVQETRHYLAAVQDRTLEALFKRPDDLKLQYFVRLSTFHADMHAEAFHYSRQTLGYVDPFAAERAAVQPAPVPSGDVEFAGGSFMLGAVPGDEFVFDNEKWAHPVEVAPFRMARSAVTNRDFAAFVAAGGYQRREWWSDEGWIWRLEKDLAAPRYWQLRDDAPRQRRFDGVETLNPDEPVIHVCWHEAQAYCRYAGRRLPTETEWEFAASFANDGESKRRYPWGDEEPDSTRANLGATHLAGVGAHAAGDSARGLRQLMGNVWEWTDSTFGPYPGFVVDPYKDYSASWFGTHKVLRGGSFATPGRLVRNTWRNFYTPDRGDIFAGFRTCALT
jgi:iron(II)-dependent oxidoreductase